MGVTQSSSSRYLMWAAQDGRLKDLLYHLRGATPEALQPCSFSAKRQAPIHLAAIAGHPGCVKALREAGSKLNMLDKDGYSPLHLAVAHCHSQCVEMLLRLGANVNVKNRFGITPLHIAASVGHTPCLEALIRGGADINAQESWGQTPLIIATLKGRIHCVKTLIQSGAWTEFKDHHHGNTALHTACNSKDEEILLALLDANTDLTITNAAGLSPLGVVLTNRFYHLVPLLLEYGAKLNALDRQHLPQKLQDYIDDVTGSPFSLLRLARIQVRQMMGPVGVNTMLSSLNLPISLTGYLKEMLSLCDPELIRELALQGGAEEYWKQVAASPPTNQIAEFEIVDHNPVA